MDVSAGTKRGAVPLPGRALCFAGCMYAKPVSCWNFVFMGASGATTIHVRDLFERNVDTGTAPVHVASNSVIASLPQYNGSPDTSKRFPKSVAASSGLTTPTASSYFSDSTRTPKPLYVFTTPKWSGMRFACRTAPAMSTSRGNGTTL